MEPIATYAEQRFDGKRTFELFADRVVVRGKTTLRSDFEVTVPLASLTPEFARVRARYSGFFAGLAIMTSSAVLAFVVAQISAKDPFEAVGFLGFVGLIGFLLSAATAAKVEWVTFASDAGVTLLTIARAGKEKARFDSFVHVLTSQIVAARSGVDPRLSGDSLPNADAN